MLCFIKIALVFSTIFVVVVQSQIVCWSGQETVSNGRRLDSQIGAPYTSVQCNNADFCYNNYVKRHKNGDDSYTITKSCGETGKCFETGCRGSHTDRVCCCIGNLCNSSNDYN
ncbi:unnamed protein product [Caenorhabditis angaria]|uniref:Uncharacterized protein n=1 Tax=Caenorhabditis angaria TaxID=860376 RepID=A0A9P1IPZ3_9PELO|nr:unnamed protein product [Caenorhabditis angaria]